jgi:hypothetical protein
MRRLRRVVPELIAVVVGLAWGVLSAIHQNATVWNFYRSELEADAKARTYSAALGHPEPPPGPFPAPGAAEWLPYSVRNAVLILAVALLGVALLRAGQRVAAVLVPAGLALLSTAGESTLAGDLLVPVDVTVMPALRPYGEGVLQALVVAAPAVLGLVLTRRTWGARPAPILRATTRQVLVRAGSVSLLGMVVLLLSGVGQSWGAADAGALGILVVVVLASGLLIASPQSLPMTAAQLAIGTAVLIVADVASGMDLADLGNNDWGTVARGSIIYFAAVAVGPAAVLLTPWAGRKWRRAFRRGPALIPLR